MLKEVYHGKPTILLLQTRTLFRFPLDSSSIPTSLLEKTVPREIVFGFTTLCLSLNFLGCSSLQSSFFMISKLLEQMWVKLGSADAIV